MKALWSTPCGHASLQVLARARLRPRQAVHRQWAGASSAPCADSLRLAAGCRQGSGSRRGI